MIIPGSLVHHRPTTPSLSARLAGAAARLRPPVLRRRRGRLLLGVGLLALVTGFVLAAIRPEWNFPV